jgi:hypothetical protein
MFDMIETLGHSGSDFRSSIVLTYSLDLPLYDGLIRRVLDRAGVWNQMLFCDFSTYVQDITSHHGALYAGKFYSITPIWQKQGVFHPKVYLLLGPRHGRLLIGSGNATVGGLIRNAEVFGLFDFDGDKAQGPHVAFPTIVEFVDQLGRHASPMVRRQIQSAKQLAPWLTAPSVRDGREVLIGGPEKQPLLTQMLASLPMRTVDSLVVCSSSFDRDLGGLQKLAAASKTPPICILQPDCAEIDGQAVQRLGKRIEWRPFIDPYPSETRRRKDVRAHAKIIVFGHGSTETCVFGSANASAPALGSVNTEVAVRLPPCPRGETVERLGLEASLRAVSVRQRLTARRWIPLEDARVDSRFACLLSAVTAAEGGYRLSFARGIPPRSALLALFDRSQGRPRAAVSLHPDGDGFVGRPTKHDEPVRFAWVLDGPGAVLSNAVAITWPTVASPRGARGVSAKISHSLAAMQDGVMLGTVLFELLDQFRDFEVLRVSSGRRIARTREAPGEETPTAEQSAEVFYTDAGIEAVGGPHWRGDRVDLDILASLVQPLTPLGTSHPHGGAEEAYYDTRLAEEAEHRQIEAQGGKATGDERQESSVGSSQQLAAAIRRLERRLNRAAASIEDSLAYLEGLQSLNPNGIARQIWMTHIGAFLANRVTLSDEGDEFVCLRPWSFASYVLRVCRALTGSKKVGGFLDKLPDSSWEGFDGEALKRGLGFLWTCAVWSVAYMVHYYTDGKGKDEIPESIAVASPELVAARFIWKVRGQCKEPDRAKLPQRFPAWQAVAVSQVAQTEQRLDGLVSLIAALEPSGDQAWLGHESDTYVLPAGTLVHNPKLGVTMLASTGSYHSYWLVDLSLSGDKPAKFAALVAPVLVDGTPYTLFQRTDGMAAA